MLPWRGTKHADQIKLLLNEMSLGGRKSAFTRIHPALVTASQKGIMGWGWGPSGYSAQMFLLGISSLYP